MGRSVAGFGVFKQKAGWVGMADEVLVVVAFCQKTNRHWAASNTKPAHVLHDAKGSFAPHVRH